MMSPLAINSGNTLLREAIESHNCFRYATRPLVEIHEALPIHIRYNEQRHIAIPTTMLISVADAYNGVLSAFPHEVRRPRPAWVTNRLSIAEVERYGRTYRYDLQ